MQKRGQVLQRCPVDPGRRVCLHDDDEKRVSIPYEIRHGWYQRKEPTTAVRTNPANPIPSSCNGVVSYCRDVGDKNSPRRHPAYDVHRIGESVVEP